ncbi:MAG TPA: beta-galactosidase, partial [Clostridia bacterium]|nr:beta-galactosidase [Clostridia bacterium]
AYRFDSAEGWRMRTEGNGGSSKLDGKRWVLDFAQGARAISLTVPDHVLLGNVDRLRLKLRGGHAGLAVGLSLRTHFMTFHKIMGTLSGEGEQELTTDGPPGPGWEWHGGENDGKIHGPLRVAEIRVVGNGQPVKCELQLDELVVDASCPGEKQCVLLAESRGTSQPEEFNVTVRALSDTALEGQLKWVFRDWDGRELNTGSRSMFVREKCSETEIKLPVPEAMVRGRKFLEAEISLDIPGQETAPVRAAWVAPLEGAGDTTMIPESPFGMGVYLNRYGGDASGLALMDRAARMARDAGVKWSREDFSWSRIQPRRGQYDWEYYDKLVDCAKRNGITVYGIACYWSGWTKPYTSEGIADYVELVKALVQRYKKDIRNWEIWNEPNIFFWQGPRDMYAELLAKSHAAIKEIDPGIQVLGLSTAGIDKAFIARMLELKAPFDVLTIHPYRKQLNDRAFINDLKNVSDQVKLPDGRPRPVWLTEMGWATHTLHNTIRQDFAANSLRTQAQLIARSYLCAIVSGVDPRTFWYNFRNDGDDPIYFEHQMGIVYNDFRPKPAYVSYATLTRVLRGKVLDRQLEAGKEVLAYRFKPANGGQGGVIATWNPIADGRVELPVPGSRVVRVNAMGETEPVEVNQGKVVIMLRKEAVEYLLSE